MEEEDGGGAFFSLPISLMIFMIIAIVMLMLRLLYVIYRSRKPVRRKSSTPLSTLIVLGSGGHTAEMLNLLEVLEKDKFSPRYYIAAATDSMSLQKARVFEEKCFADNE